MTIRYYPRKFVRVKINPYNVIVYGIFSSVVSSSFSPGRIFFPMGQIPPNTPTLPTKIQVITQKVSFLMQVRIDISPSLFICAKQINTFFYIKYMSKTYWTWESLFNGDSRMGSTTTLFAFQFFILPLTLKGKLTEI